MRRKSAVVSVLLGLIAPAAASAQAPPIQPGDWSYPVTPEPGACTLGWVFDGSDGHVYFASAAHCGPAGTDVMISDPAAVAPAASELLGKVAMAGNEGHDASLDVSLIRVREELANRVQSELRGHPGVPAGVIAPEDAAPGDQLLFSGWGTGFEASAPTREMRRGIFFEGDAFSWAGLLPTTGGDSGGPVAHLPSKSAIGVNKGGRCTTTSTWACAMYGGSIAAVQRLAEKNGLKVTLRVAGAPRPARPQTQPPAQTPPPAGDDQPRAQDPPSANLTIKAGKLSARAIKRSRRFRVTLRTSRALTDVSALLTRGKRTLAVGTANSLSARGRVTLRLRRAVRPGRHTLVATGTDDLGRAVRATARVKVAR